MKKDTPTSFKMNSRVLCGRKMHLAQKNAESDVKTVVFAKFTHSTGMEFVNFFWPYLRYPKLSRKFPWKELHRARVPKPLGVGCELVLEGNRHFSADCHQHDLKPSLCWFRQPLLVIYPDEIKQINTMQSLFGPRLAMLQKHPKIDSVYVENARDWFFNQVLGDWIFEATEVPKQVTVLWKAV